MTIAIVDYGMGNLRSVQKALEKLGAETRITASPMEIINADKVVLPGVGAMAPAMKKLQEIGLVDAIRRVTREGKPFLGICLGLQLLFETSTEGGWSEGLRIVPGTVDRFQKERVPHMGWNQVQVQPAGQAMFAGIPPASDVYFCHSYFVKPKDPSIVAATTQYGTEYVSAIVQKNIWGVQFHPEKSQNVGLHVLKNFVSL